MTDAKTLATSYRTIASGYLVAADSLDPPAETKPLDPAPAPVAPVEKPEEPVNLLPESLRSGRIPNNWQGEDAEVALPSGTYLLTADVQGTHWTGLRARVDGVDLNRARHHTGSGTDTLKAFFASGGATHAVRLEAFEGRGEVSWSNAQLLRVGDADLPAPPTHPAPAPETPKDPLPAPQPAGPAPAPSTRFLAGVNLSVMEFGENKPMPGALWKEYGTPTREEIAYFADKGMGLIRLPFRWERMQRVLFGDLHKPDLDLVRAVVDEATKRGLVVVLDLHNYARYKVGDQELVIGVQGLSITAFADVWRRLALAFKDRPHVWFGLMNEPHDMPTTTWLQAANAAAKAIRETGATNKILVSGNHWDGAHSWVSSDNDEVMAGFVDPGRNFGFEVHQYLDANSSGSTAPAVTGKGAKVLVAVTEWARKLGVQLFLGEFAWLATQADRTEGEAMLAYVEANRDVWIGWAWWAAGPWWGNYPFSIEPEGGWDKPQMADLLPFIQRARG